MTENTNREIENIASEEEAHTQTKPKKKRHTRNVYIHIPREDEAHTHTRSKQKQGHTQNKQYPERKRRTGTDSPRTGAPSMISNFVMVSDSLYKSDPDPARSGVCLRCMSIYVYLYVYLGIGLFCHMNRPLLLYE